jgi:hypothetical protein
MPASDQASHSTVDMAPLQRPRAVLGRWTLGVFCLGLGTALAGTAPGCGNEAEPTDAGTEAGPVVDAGSEGDASATCAVTVDLLNLPVPPAPIGDGGATTTQCYACGTSVCRSQLSACNDDCDCKTVLVTAFTCLATAPNPQDCLSSLVGAAAGSQALQPLALCMGFACRSACGFDITPSPADSGTPVDGGGDGASADGGDGSAGDGATEGG